MLSLYGGVEQPKQASETTIMGAFAGVARLGLALAGAQWPCLRPWPSLEAGYAEPKTTPLPGPGETRLGFVSPELGCARRSRGDFGWRRGGSRGTVKLPSRACRGAGSQIRRALAPIVSPINQLPVAMALLLPLLALVTFFLLPEGRAVRSCAWRRRVPPVYSSVLLPVTAAGGTRWRWCSSSSPSPSSSSTSRSASSTCRSSSSPTVLPRWQGEMDNPSPLPLLFSLDVPCLRVWYLMLFTCYGCSVDASCYCGR